VSRYCFITGFLRSGTTLVEKLVHSLPGACIGPQPFPFLYRDLKRAFLGSLGGVDERYPLGHLFREDRYGPADFEAFLDAHRVTPADLAAAFASMEGYSGWKLPELASALPHVPGGSFAETYRALCDALPALLDRPSAELLGAKEVFTEEFVPYLLREGISVVLVVRDVRDVLTSLKLGSAGTYVDRGLPALHIIRQWRKSVAFALELEGRPGFRVVRHEEVARDPLAVLGDLAAFLAVGTPSDAAAQRIVAQDGAPWQGNSSFGELEGVSAASVGRFVDRLPRAWLALVERLCAPEMHALGYAPVSGDDAAEAAFEDLFERAAPDLVLVGPGERLEIELSAERERARLLEGSAGEADQRRWFIYPRAYRRLLPDRPTS